MTKTNEDYTTMRVRRSDYQILKNICPYLSAGNTFALLIDMITDGDSEFRVALLKDVITDRIKVVSHAVDRERLELDDIERKKKERYSNMKRRPTSLDKRLDEIDLSDLDGPRERLDDEDKFIIIEEYEKSGSMHVAYSKAFRQQQERELMEFERMREGSV